MTKSHQKDVLFQLAPLPDVAFSDSTVKAFWSALRHFNLGHDVIYGHIGINFSELLGIVAVAGRELTDKAHRVGDS
jgi:hypothetical protein